MDLSRFDNQKLRRRDFQFSLARLLVAMTLCAVLLSLQLPLFMEWMGWGLLVLVVFSVLFCDWSYRHTIHGTQALAAGDFRGALAAFDRAIEADPEDAGRRYLRGIAHAWLDDLEAAEGDYTKAIELDGRYAPAWVSRANARRRRGESQEAIDDASIALCLLPPDPDLVLLRAMALVVRGSCYRALGRIEEAEEELEEAVRIAPDRWEPYLLRGSVRLEAKDYHQALGDFDEALERGARDRSTLIRRATALFKLGDHEAAVAQIEDCLRAYPRALDALGTYAWFLATCPNDALRDGERALRLATTARALGAEGEWLCEASLAAACAELGRFDEAVEHAEKGLESAPPVCRGDLEAPLATYRQGRPYRDRGSASQE